MQVSRVDELLAKNSLDVSKGKNTGVAPTVFAAQKEAESGIKADISDSYEENVKKDLENANKNSKTPVNADTFFKWKSDLLAKNPAPEGDKKKVDPSVMLNDEKALLGPKVDLTQSLARAVAPPSPAKYMSESSVLAAALSHENAAIEQIQTQLTSAYQRIFAEVEAKMAVQQAEVETLSAAQDAKDSEIKRLQAVILDQEKSSRDAKEKLKIAESTIDSQAKELKEVKEKLKTADSTVDSLQKKLAAVPLSVEDQIKASSQKVADSIRGTFDSSIGKALTQESADNASIEVNRIANAIKKEIAISFLKELNTARKNGDETASLSQSSLGLSVLNPAKNGGSYATTSTGPSYVAGVSGAKKLL